jgi:hypothetical protein
MEDVLCVAFLAPPVLTFDVTIMFDGECDGENSGGEEPQIIED